MPWDALFAVKHPYRACHVERDVEELRLRAHGVQGGGGGNSRRRYREVLRRRYTMT